MIFSIQKLISNPVFLSKTRKKHPMNLIKPNHGLQKCKKPAQNQKSSQVRIFSLEVFKVKNRHFGCLNLSQQQLYPSMLESSNPLSPLPKKELEKKIKFDTKIYFLKIIGAEYLIA
jgi:hypothetical protein